MCRDTFPGVLIQADGTIDTEAYAAIATTERHEEMRRVGRLLAAAARRAVRFLIKDGRRWKRGEPGAENAPHTDA